MGVGLINMRVERIAWIGHVEDPRPESRCNQGGDAIQPESRQPIIHRWTVAGTGLVHALFGTLRAACDAKQKFFGRIAWFRVGAIARKAACSS